MLHHKDTGRCNGENNIRKYRADFRGNICECSRNSTYQIKVKAF